MVHDDAGGAAGLLELCWLCETEDRACHIPARSRSDLRRSSAGSELEQIFCFYLQTLHRRVLIPSFVWLPATFPAESWIRPPLSPKIFLFWRMERHYFPSAGSAVKTWAPAPGWTDGGWRDGWLDRRMEDDGWMDGFPIKAELKQAALHKNPNFKSQKLVKMMSE